MNRCWIFIRHLTGCLTMVAMMALALHGGAMSEPAADTAVSSSHATAASSASDHFAAVSLPADHDNDSHTHGKTPCKSACCGVSCTLVLSAASVSLVLAAKPDKRIAFPELATLESHSLSGLKRPPRLLLNV
ncbi:hypothetical protein LGH83_08875 [Lichenihabitans sp. PAMC28606]|uniref:hypothetical protein n=1 Tax=Lichenihabitans sp. PAMC28606 TaxID=2880932 RepID=UPI001D0B1F0F|nr:hypothetical protein [Lichenihabitans sp. PAMC28606]UDL96271.1 hypothetical protein LGH83_08875 [Lichenihabitans sp. PAMC28606]